VWPFGIGYWILGIGYSSFVRLADLLTCRLADLPAISTTRLWTLVCLLGIVPLGFATKFYAGPAAHWVNNSVGGVPYEIFWCLLIFLIVPRARPGIIAAAVLVATCLLEFLQLWHPPLLEALRSTFIGRTVLGTSFTWSDFPYYFLGCGVAWVGMRWLRGPLKLGGMEECTNDLLESPSS
jgi:hypothetical protein